MPTNQGQIAMTARTEEGAEALGGWRLGSPTLLSAMLVPFPCLHLIWTLFFQHASSGSTLGPLNGCSLGL